MKLLVVLALAAFVAAEPEAEATAAADPYYYGGYGLGYGGYGVRTYGYGLGGYYGGYRGYYGKREAEAEPEATAAADPYYYGGYGLRSYGYGLRSYGLGYGRGYYCGRSLLLRRLRPEVLRLLWTRLRLRPSWRLLRRLPRRPEELRTRLRTWLLRRIPWRLLGIDLS